MAQAIVELSIENKEPATGAAGHSRLKTIFGKSPIYTGDLTDKSQRDFYLQLLTGEINDGGHTFGTFDPSFNGAPDLNDVATGGAGLPASPHVPNPVSPGPGSASPTDQATAPEGFGTVKSDIPFTGNGTLNPKETSRAISAQNFRELGLGRSV